MATFNVQAALKAGYTQDQINQYLNSNQYQNDLAQINSPPEQSLASKIGGGVFDFAKGLVAPTTNTISDVAQNPQNYQPNLQDRLGAIAGPLGALLTGGNQAQKLLPSELNTASFAVPFAPKAGLLAGILAPGAAVGAMQRAAEPGATTANVVGSGALGAAGAGLIHGIAQIPGLLSSKAAPALDEASTATLKAQYNVTPKTAGKLRLGQTVSDLADFGVKNIKDVETLAPKITGSDGLITQITKEAVSNAPPVDVGGLSGIADDLLANQPLIGESAGSKFKSFVQRGIQSSAGGENVSGGDPSKLFSFVQDLEKQGATLSRGSSDEARALGAVYREFANNITDRLFGGFNSVGEQVAGAGADNVIAKGLITPDILDKAKAINPALADRLANVQTVADLRSLAAPFVRGAQLAEETANRIGNKIITGKDIMAGGLGALTGMAHGAVGGPLGAAAGIAVEKGMSTPEGITALSNILSGASKVASKVPTSVANPIIDNLLGQAGAQGAASLSGGGDNINQGNQGAAQTTQNQSSHTTSIPDMSNPQTNVKRITPEQVAAAQLYLPQAIAARVEAAYKAQTGGATTQQVGLVRAGQKSVNDVEKMYKNDPSLLTKQLVPGQYLSRQFDSALYDAVDALLRLRTGAQANPAEIRGYMTRIGPTFGDSSKDVQYKLNKLRSDLNSYIGQ